MKISLTTYDRIAAVLTGPMGIDGARVSPGARFNEIGFDSLGFADFQFELEQEFKIPIDIESNPILENVSTLNELALAIDNIKAAMHA